MLGWEYPPHITGGLGTACQGLTVALAALNIKVDFVVPELIGDELANHMNLIDSSKGIIVNEAGTSTLPTSSVINDSPNVNLTKIPAFLAPYWTEEAYQEHINKIDSLGDDVISKLLPEEVVTFLKQSASLVKVKTSHGYHGDLFSEVDRYANNVALLMSKGDFDIIHAHDWITFPAAVRLSRITGKPFVAHVHSLESDRAGSSGNSRVKDIERLGLHGASKIIAVSHYTASLISREHSISLDKISVVHNGVYPREVISKYRREANWKGKIVLFLGRVTFQKGPDYFVEAAARVIPHVPDVVFAMAGAGDMLPAMVERVTELGINEHFRFTGFLKGKEVEEMFSIADLYVMPSVSEPFGLSALEAINFETPVIISRQSGVSEVLTHALKVDFWDVQKLSDMIINCLIHKEIGEDMVSMAREELRRLRWEAAALRTCEVYRSIL
jgi:glycogen synthase